MKLRSLGEAGLAVLLAIVVVTAAGAFGSGAGREADLRASTWLDDRAGTRALLLVLEACGVRTARSAEPPSADADTAATLAVLAPSWPVTKPEAAAILDWTARGGRLVVADATSSPPALSVDVSVLLAPLGLRTESAGDSHGATVTVEEEARGAGDGFLRIDWPARLHLVEGDEEKRDERAGEAEPLVRRSQSDLVVRIPFGEGEVVAISDVSLLSNDVLRRGDDAVLAVRLLAPDGRAVTFDEFHHGWTPTGMRTGIVGRVGEMLVTTWPGRALLVLAAAGLVVVAGGAVRFGAPIEEPPPARRALREHADALGRLLEGARASRETLLVLVEGVRRSVASRVGLPPRATPTDLCERLRRSVAPGAAELADAVQAAVAAAGPEGAPPVKDVELAGLAANLAAARRRFVRGGSTP